MEYPGGLSYKESEELITEADYKISERVEIKPKVVKLRQKREIATAASINLEAILAMARTATLAIIIYVILALIL